jgi:hypothetical protein
MKTIIVEISTTGEVKIDAVGFTGNACEKATAAIEAALGKTVSRQRKPEATQHTVGNQQKAGR